MAEGSSSGSHAVIKDAALAAFAAMSLDLFVEMVRFPDILNKQSPIPIGDPQATIMESILYGSSALLMTLGAMDMLGVQVLPGIKGPSAVATGGGIWLGTQVYENQVVKYLGIVRQPRHG